MSRARRENLPLGEPPAPAQLQEAVAGAICEDGIGLDLAFSLFKDVIVPASQAVDHPRYFGFIGYSPAVAAVILDMVQSAVALFGTSWIEGAGSVVAEHQALRWLADLAGFGPTAGGTFMNGGTASNLTGLAVGRDWWQGRNPDDHGRLAIAASSEVHPSIRLAARVLGVDIVPVSGDERGRLTGARLRAVLRATDARVFAVVATAGTTNSGAIDDLAGVASVCERDGLWFHVDGAYGGAALTSPTARDLLIGIERADSLVIDPHKWLFSTLDCSALLYRDARYARAFLRQDAAYLDAMHGGDIWDPTDYGIHLTRRARGVPLWFALAAHGTAAFGAAVDASIRLAQETARLIERTPHLELATEPDLSVVIFRRHGWGIAEYEAWSKQLLRDGIAMALPTVWRGETLLRLCFVHPETTLDDVRAVLDTLAPAAS